MQAGPRKSHLVRVCLRQNGYAVIYKTISSVTKRFSFSIYLNYLSFGAFDLFVGSGFGSWRGALSKFPRMADSACAIIACGSEPSAISSWAEVEVSVAGPCTSASGWLFSGDMLPILRY
jgi:hypothetical protein